MKPWEFQKQKQYSRNLDVEPTLTLHNLLFLVRKLISNKLVEAFDWLSCRKKRVFVVFFLNQSREAL